MTRSTDWLDGPLRDSGFTNLQEAVVWAGATGATSAELAQHLGVNWHRLIAELRANGLRLPPVGARMIAAAREHVAAGRSLTECPPDMRQWFHTLLRNRADGRAGNTYGDLLDALDPSWRTV